MVSESAGGFRGRVDRQHLVAAVDPSEEPTFARQVVKEVVN